MSPSIRHARHALILSWAAYAILWAAALTSTSWASPGSGLLVVSGFGFGLLVALVALAAALATAIQALRAHGAWRARLDVALVALSTVGLGVQAYYAWRFLDG